MMITSGVNAQYASKLLILLSWLVRKRILRRAYARVIRMTPYSIWGGRFIYINTSVGEMCFDLKDSGGIQMLLWGIATHERNESLVIAKLAPRLKCFVDIGANVGWYPRLLIASGFAGGAASIMAIEANPEIYKILYQNCFRHTAIRTEAFAASAADGTVDMFCAAQGNLSSSVRVVGRREKVDARSLDSYCGERDMLDRVDFVKCDVEGGEFDVLLGARELRRRRRPPIWMLEFEEDFLEEAKIDRTAILTELMVEGKKALHYFRATETGCLARLQSPFHREGSSNVFVIPGERLADVADLVI